jgi:hypothetical protein
MEKVFDTMITYSTNSLFQVMINTLNVVCSYFLINMYETSYSIMRLVSDYRQWN